jgi:hypothetical protein
MAKTPTSTPASEDASAVTTSDYQAYTTYGTDIIGATVGPTWGIIFDFQYDSSGFVLGGQYIWKRLPERSTGGSSTPTTGPAAYSPIADGGGSAQAEAQGFDGASSNYVDLSLLANDAVGIVRAHAHGAFSSALYDDEDMRVFNSSTYDSYYLVGGSVTPHIGVIWMTQEEWASQNASIRATSTAATRYVSEEAIRIPVLTGRTPPDEGTRAFAVDIVQTKTNIWEEIWVAAIVMSSAEIAGLKDRFGAPSAAPGESAAQTRILDQYGDFLQNLSAHTTQNQSLYKKISYRKLRMTDASSIKGTFASATTSITTMGGVSSTSQTTTSGEKY